MNLRENVGLPSGWVKTALGDLTDILRGVSYKKPDSRDSADEGLIPILRATNIDGTLNFSDLVYVPAKYVSREQFLRSGDIVVAASSGSRSVVGKAAQLTSDWHGSFGAFCLALRPRSAISSAFVAHFLQTAEYRSRVASLAAGEREHVANTAIPLAPRTEQDRVVLALETQLSRLQSARALLLGARAALAAYRASVRKAACEGRLVPTEAELVRAEGRDYEPADQLLARILKERRARWEADQLAKLTAKGKPPKDDGWKKKYVEPESPDRSNLADLPEGWCWASVESISAKVVDGVHKKPNYVLSGIPFVTVRNLTAGPGIDLSRLNFVTAADHLEFSKRANPERGDILISKDGTLGVVRRIRTDEPFSIFVSVALIKPVDLSLSEYLEYALAAPQVQRQMVPKGSGLQHIHLEDLRRDCIPIPPVAEQQRIVAEVERRLSIADQAEATIEAALVRAQGLRQALLKRAFEGRLVPQNPSDEPASVLLERIRKQREAQAKAQAKPGRSAPQRRSAARRTRRA